VAGANAPRCYSSLTPPITPITRVVLGVADGKGFSLSLSNARSDGFVLDPKRSVASVGLLPSQSAAVTLPLTRESGKLPKMRKNCRDNFGVRPEEYG
jgi:hypothetical protein